MVGLSVCENPDVLRVIYFVKILIDIVKTIIPIALIIIVIWDCAKGVISGDSKIGDKLKLNVNRLIYAILIFCVPTIVNIVLEVIDEQTAYESCLVNAETSTIEYYQSLADELERQKEEEIIQQEEQLKYPASSSHTNSINGIKYKLYNQSDPEWGSVKYTSSEKTISDIGCMITAVAVVSSSVDASITPLTVFNSNYRHAYPYNGINYFGEGYFSCKHSSIDYDNIVNNLKKGNVAVIMVKEDSNFTGSQHYMALIDIKSDGSQIFVGNSYGTGTGSYNRSGWFNTGVVLTDVHELNICEPTQALYDRFN